MLKQEMVVKEDTMINKEMGDEGEGAWLADVLAVY